MNPQFNSPNSPVPDNSSLQQGYLQVIRNGEAIKVFAILTPKKLLIYSEDPTKYQNAELSSSIDIAKSKLLEEGNFKRPKSFGVFSDQNFLEFSCATNSSRLSWLKSFNNAKESSDSLQKLKGIKATMDLYRAPTAVGKSNPPSNPAQASPLASSPNHASILRSKFSGGSTNLFGDTFSQLRTLNVSDSFPQQQLQQTQQQHPQKQLQQSHVSFSTPSLVVQPKLKKNTGKATTSSQHNEVKEPPRWIPGNYKVPGKASNNRGITPHQQTHVAPSGYQRAASAPNRRPNEKNNNIQNNQILFTPVGAPNLFATGDSREYSSLQGQPLSINTLQHNQQQFPQQQLPQQPQSAYSYQQPSSFLDNSLHKEYPSLYPQQQHPGHALHYYQQAPNNSLYSSNIPPTYSNGNIPPFPQSAPASGPNAMEHLTLAQIRAALMSIPVPIRSALMGEDFVASKSEGHHSTRSVGNRDDIARSINSNNRPQHRAPPTKEMSDYDSSSLDSGYVASGGKKKKANIKMHRKQLDLEDSAKDHHHNRQPYQEEEMLGATTYSDSHFQMRSRQLYYDQNQEEEEGDFNNDDANGYGMANIYSNGGSPDEKLMRDDVDLVVSARSNPLLKSQSLKLDSLSRSNSIQIKTSKDATAAKKLLLEQGKRPNPLQRSKSAPVIRPATTSASIPQQLQFSKSPADGKDVVNNHISNEKVIDKEVRDSILTWSKRQARDKRIGMNYFGNTKKGVQLMQSQGVSENRSNSASPQRRASSTDFPVVEFSKPLAFRKTPILQSVNQETSNKLGSSQLGKQLKTTPPSSGTKSFFDFKRSSKTTDVAASQHPQTALMCNANNNNIGKPLQPQQQQNLEQQLLIYQQRLQQKRQQGSEASAPAQSKPSFIPSFKQQNPTNALTITTAQASGIQQKLQLDYAAKRQALLVAPPSSRPKPVVPPQTTFSRSTSYQSTPTTRPNRSESYESAMYNNSSHVGEEEITDKAESHRFRCWLESIDMDHYLSIMRDNGVSKLSVLELLTRNDLAQIGIPELDATIILEKARELTERIKSFSENVDTNDWKTMSHNNGMPSGKLATPTSISRRKDSYAAQTQKLPESPSAMPLTIERIIELKSKLTEAYKAGELDKFFMFWERLPSFPHPDPNFKSPDLHAFFRAERPALVTAKQAMEFHLYLYFFVYSLKNLSSNKISVLKAKSALRKYLDKIASSQQDDSSAPCSPNKVSSPLSPAQVLQQLNVSVDPSTSPVNTSFDNTYDCNLYATKEFATFAGLVFVPNPQTNPAFQSLFRDEWSTALLERLQKFLDVVFPDEATKTTVKEPIVPVENEEAVDFDKIHANSTYSPCGVKVDGINEIIRPAPIRPAADISVSIQSGSDRMKKTIVPDMFMSPPPQQLLPQEQQANPLILPQVVTPADSQKMIAKVPSVSSSFESPLPQPPLSVQSIRSQTVTPQKELIPVHELPSPIASSLVAPITTTQPSPHQESGNVTGPSPAKVLVEEDIGNDVTLLDGDREACLSPASSISQLTDDTPLNRVSATLNGQPVGNTGYSQHTMNSWLQNSQPTTVAGTRPQRIKVSLGSPSQTANNITSHNRKSPGAGVSIPPTTVLMPLNQRNLLSIQQQQQLQQFQQQFGYSPISPGGSRVSGGRSSGNNNTTNLNSHSGGPQMEKILDITIDQLDISPVGSPPQAQQNIKQNSSINQEGTLSTSQNQGKPDPPKAISSPSMQHPRSKTANQASSKSSLQSQVDSYNRLLKMKKLTAQSAQPPTTPPLPAAAAVAVPVVATVGVQKHSQPQITSDGEKIRVVEEATNIEHVVPVVADDQNVEATDVPVYLMATAITANGIVAKIDEEVTVVKEGSEVTVVKEISEAAPNEIFLHGTVELPSSSSVREVEVKDEVAIDTEPMTSEESNTNIGETHLPFDADIELVLEISQESGAKNESAKEDAIPIHVDSVEDNIFSIVEPQLTSQIINLEPPSSSILEVSSDEKITLLSENEAEKLSMGKLENETLIPDVAHDVASNIVEEQTEAVTSEIIELISPKIDSMDMSTTLDTSAFSIDNVKSESNGLEASLPVFATKVEDATVSQQAAKYKVLLRSNQKKKKKSQNQQH